MPAQGEVYVPAGEELHLQVSHEAVADGTLGATDLAGVVLSGTEVQDHQLLFLEGLRTTIFLDEKVCWTHDHQPNGESTLRKLDVQELRRHNVRPEEYVHALGFAHPFTEVNLDTLRVESEDKEHWNFTAQPADYLKVQYKAIYLKIRKEDGVLQWKSYCQRDTGPAFWMELEEIEINPNLPEDAFSYTPPRDVEVKDETADLLAARGKKPAVPE